MKQKALKLTVTKPSGEVIYEKIPATIETVGATLHLHDDVGLLITLEIVEYEPTGK